LLAALREAAADLTENSSHQIDDDNSKLAVHSGVAAAAGVACDTFDTQLGKDAAAKLAAKGAENSGGSNYPK
jgi:hypothetical protein